jgi:hypothetical protein
VAPGIVAPEGSVTRPEICALDDCACSPGADSSNNTATRAATEFNLNLIAKHPPTFYFTYFLLRIRHANRFLVSVELGVQALFTMPENINKVMCGPTPALSQRVRTTIDA